MFNVWLLTRELTEDMAQGLLTKDLPTYVNHTPISIREGFSKLNIQAKIIRLNDIENEKILPNVAIDCYPPWSESEFKKLVRLENLGVKVLNKPIYHARYHNKWNQAKKLIESGISIPKTIEITLPPTDKNLLSIKEIGYPVVIKGNISGHATSVFKCMTEDDVIDACMKIYKMPNQIGFIRTNSVIAQQWIDHRKFGIIRVHVAGYKAIGAQQRRPSIDMDFFISNIGSQSKRNQFDMTTDLIELCESSCRALNLEIATLDIMHDGKKFIICEVNTIGTFKSIDEYPNINCGLEIAKYIMNEYSKC